MTNKHCDSRTEDLASSDTLGFVLAGGKSSRMGQDKGQLCIGERDLVSLACDVLIKSGVDNVVVSSNHIESALADKVANCGPLSAIHSIVHEPIAAHYQGMVVLPVDMPLIDSEQLRLLRQYGQSHETTCCYQQSYLPAYIPFTQQLSQFIEEQLSSRCYAFKLLLAKLQFKQLALQPSSNQNAQLSPFYNINTPEQWLTFKQSAQRRFS
ncbi:molybdenum cofactor guanylyltransferase [Aliiglaciecola litoralis]|uniref:Molybdenum cofactor guanylyltransferase n=1 Tax=Aliiglaciecola litoralis TaxID=582857 RepID=A0ABN1LCS1_9ALTE